MRDTNELAKNKDAARIVYNRVVTLYNGNYNDVYMHRDFMHSTIRVGIKNKKAGIDVFVNLAYDTPYAVNDLHDLATHMISFTKEANTDVTD